MYLHQNEVFYITFILGIIIVLCITAGYWEVDRRQEKYIRTLLEYQEKLQQSNEETKRANQAKSEFLFPYVPRYPHTDQRDHGYGGDHQEKSG